MKMLFEKVSGIVKDIEVKSNDVTVMTVVYSVNGQEYEIKEKLKFKNEPIKIGFLPIGQRSLPVIGVKKIGDKVGLFYNPNNHSEAFLAGNNGIWTA